MMYTEQHQQDPLILLNSQHIDDLLVPITIKPLPALLAPPTNLSLSTTSLQTPNTANSYYQYNNTEPHMESVSVSEQSPLPRASLPDLPPTTTTPNYYTVIQKQSQEIQDLRHDLIRLNQKYIDQIERMQTAEQAKHQVESELEDLSLRLFEQANQMVSDEKKARFHAEKKITQLERELTSVYEELGNEKAQLSELRVKIHAPSIHPLEQQQQQQRQQQPQNHEQRPHGISSAAYLDRGWLNLFKDFLTLAPKTPLEQMNRLPFLKQCLELDIEPCLRFGNNSKSGQLSMRRVLDAIIHQSCFIESETNFEKRRSHDTRMPTTSAVPLVVARRSSFAQITSRFRSSSSATVAVKQSCYGCGIELQAPLFRFRLKEQDTEYFTIDRSCRDRLVAVCDFYVFIRNVRMGLQSQKTIQCLFRECVWLRLCMFWARSGIHHDNNDEEEALAIV